MKNLIEQLIENGVVFAAGMTEEELCRAEGIYDIVFPKSLREFYKIALPIDCEKGNFFPVWNDFSEDNILSIKERMEIPIEGLISETEKGWRSKDEVEMLLSKAPKLIPVYSHRYMPMLDETDDPFVISIVGIDMIYYGRDLKNYLSREFILQTELDTKGLYLPIWAELTYSARNYYPKEPVAYLSGLYERALVRPESELGVYFIRAITYHRQRMISNEVFEEVCRNCHDIIDTMSGDMRTEFLSWIISVDYSNKTERWRDLCDDEMLWQSILDNRKKIN